MQDILNALQASGTITDSANSTGLDLGLGGTLRRTLFARILHSATSNASGAATITYKIQHSADNSTWYDHSSGAKDIITTSTTAQAGEIFIPICTDLRYIRLVTTFSTTTGTPTTTREAHLVQVAW
jgi:hypothetical protein